MQKQKSPALRSQSAFINEYFWRERSLVEPVGIFLALKSIRLKKNRQSYCKRSIERQWDFQATKNKFNIGEGCFDKSSSKLDLLTKNIFLVPCMGQKLNLSCQASCYCWKNEWKRSQATWRMAKQGRIRFVNNGILYWPWKCMEVSVPLL